MGCVLSSQENIQLELIKTDSEYSYFNQRRGTTIYSSHFYEKYKVSLSSPVYEFVCDYASRDIPVNISFKNNPLALYQEIKYIGEARLELIVTDIKMNGNNIFELTTDYIEDVKIITTIKNFEIGGTYFVKSFHWKDDMTIVI